MDPDPDSVIFIIDLHYASKKLFFLLSFLLITFEAHLYNFSKIKSQKEVTKQ
jgi:hypothetical protein